MADEQYTNPSKPGATPCAPDTTGPDGSGCPDANSILSLFDAQLSERRAREVRDHIDECPPCQGLTASVARWHLPDSGSHAEDSNAENRCDPSEVVRPGTLVGRYQVERLIGFGGMGVVYAARDEALDRVVALKLLRMNRRGDVGEAELARESKLMARLSHPNIATVFDIGQWQGRVFVAMELAGKGTAARWLARRRSPEKIVEVFGAAASALWSAHQASIVHGDFKPANLLLTGADELKVCDFGLARVVGDDPDMAANRNAIGAIGNPSDDALRDISRTQVLSQPGAIGTPAYMAPEQYDGLPATTSSDQFSFCVALYEAFCGERPFVGKTPRDVREAMKKAPSTYDKRIPSHLRALIRRGLSIDPSRRFDSMEPFVGALTTPSSKDVFSRRRAVGLSVLAIAAAAVGITVAQRLIGHGDAAAQACQGEAERLESVWSAAQHRDVLAALSDKHGDVTAQRTLKRLDNYADRWRSVHRETCNASQRGEQSESLLDVRMHCLDRRLERLADVVGVLQDPKLSSLAEIHRAADRLRSPQSCSRAELVESRRPEPEGEPQRTRVEQLRRDLDRAHVLLEIVAYDESERLLAGLVDQADSIGFPAAIAEVNHVRGMSLAVAGETKQALELQRGVALEAQAVRHDDLAARAWLYVTFLYAQELGDIEEAKAALSHVESTVRRLGDAPLLIIEYHTAAGLVAYVDSNPTSAETHFRTAVRLRDQLEPASRSQSSEDSLNGLAFALEAQGKVDEAVAIYRRLLSTHREEYGEHPDSIGYIVSIAVALQYLSNDTPDERREILDHMNEAVRLAKKLYGDEHPLTAQTLHNRGSILAAMDKYTEALADQRAAGAIFAAGMPDMKLQLAKNLAGQGESLTGLGRSAEAEPLIRRSLAIEIELAGEPSLGVAESRGFLSEALAGQGRIDDAISERQRALAIVSAVEGLDPVLVANELFALASLWATKGNVAKVLSHASRGKKVLDGHDYEQAAKGAVEFFHAKALWKQPARRAEALVHAQTAARLFEQSESSLPAEAELKAWLAEREAAN